MKNNHSISFLKVRAGYGKTGNADLPNYQWRGTFNPPSVLLFDPSNQLQQGENADQIGHKRFHRNDQQKC